MFFAAVNVNEIKAICVIACVVISLSVSKPPNSFGGYRHRLVGKDQTPKNTFDIWSKM